MKNFTTTLFFALLTISSFIQAQTVVKATVRITGEVTNPLIIDVENIQKFKKKLVIRKDRDGHNHRYSGILLSDLLKTAGVTLDAELKGKNLTKYLLAEGSDGYQVIYSLAELDSGYTNRRIILADQVDGKPLPSAEGPFRIIVQDEKKPARCVRQLTTLMVKYAI